MARIKGVEAKQAGWFVRALYALARRKVGQLTGRKTLPEPMAVAAHHPRLLIGYGQMEMAQAAAHSVPERIKSLSSIKSAALIGCPY